MRDTFISVLLSWAGGGACKTLKQSTGRGRTALVLVVLQGNLGSVSRKQPCARVGSSRYTHIHLCHLLLLLSLDFYCRQNSFCNENSGCYYFLLLCCKFVLYIRVHKREVGKEGRKGVGERCSCTVVVLYAVLLR